MDELTTSERRLVLAALWRFKERLGVDFDGASSDDSADALHEISTMDLVDSAARKLGGDPSEHLYGAPKY
ncbi:MAG: hypothetical protein LC808_16195 [Actinobacteria bacterium]|nr:hypothetical protein [Actinomycetota bacterium]